MLQMRWRLCVTCGAHLAVRDVAAGKQTPEASSDSVSPGEYFGRVVVPAILIVIVMLCACFDKPDEGGYYRPRHAAATTAAVRSAEVHPSEACHSACQCP